MPDSHLIVPHNDRDIVTLEAMKIGDDPAMITLQFAAPLHGVDFSIDDAHSLVDTLQTVIRSAQALDNA